MVLLRGPAGVPSERRGSDQRLAPGGCFCAQQQRGVPLRAATPGPPAPLLGSAARQASPLAGVPYGAAAGLQPGCTWPRCVVPVLNARLGSGSGGAGGSGAASSGSSSSSSSAWGASPRGVVPGAVAAPSMQAGLEPDRIGASTSTAWPAPLPPPVVPQQQQQEQQQYLAADVNSRSSGTSSSSGGASSSRALKGGAAAGTAAAGQSEQRRGLLADIDTVESFWQLRSLWRHAIQKRGSSGSSGRRASGSRVRPHHVVAVLRRLAQVVLEPPAQLGVADGGAEQLSSQAAASLDAEAEDWEGAWQSVPRAADVAIGSWDGGDGIMRASGPTASRRRSLAASPRSRMDRPEAAAPGSLPVPGMRQGPPARSSSDSWSSPLASSDTGDARRLRRLWPATDVEGLAQAAASPPPEQQQQQRSLQALEREWEQAQPEERDGRQRLTAAGVQAPPSVPSQQQQQQQQQPRASSWPSASKLRRPPPRTAEAIALASRSGDDDSPGLTASFSTLDEGGGSSSSSSSSGGSSSQSGGPADEPASEARAPADAATQRRPPVGGTLLTSAEMSSRAQRMPTAMTRAYGGSVAVLAARSGPPRGAPMPPSGSGAPTPAEVESLIRDVLRALRRCAPQLSPRAAASALRSLSELRRNDAATIGALLAGPLAPELLSADGRTASTRGSVGLQQQLGGVVTSLAALGHEPPQSWLAGASAALVERPSEFLASRATEAGDAARLVFHLARAGWRPGPEACAAVAAALQPRLVQLSPTELSQALQALSLIGHAPDETWQVDFFTASRRALRDTPPLRLVHALDALVALGLRPDDAWLRAALGALGSSELRELPPTAWPLLMSALSRLSARPDGAWLRTAYAICAAHTLRRLPPRGLADLATSVAGLGMLPPAAWVAELASAAFWQLRFARADELADLGRALAALRAAPGPVWTQQFEARTALLLRDCGGPQLAALLASMVGLRHRPGSAWLSAFEAASHGRLSAFGPEGLASTAHALVELGAAPSLSWVYAFVLAAYDALEAFDAAQLAALFDALPRLAPHPRWVDDLVQICGIEAARRRQAAAHAAAAASTAVAA